MVNSVLLAAVLAPLAALIAAIILYLRHRKPPSSDTRRRSAALFIAGTLAVAIALAYLAFNYLPWVLCEGLVIELGGAGCALSVYASAPLGFTIGTLVYAALWSLHGRSAR